MRSLSTLNRCSEGAFNRPAFMQASDYINRTKAIANRPVGNTEGLAIYRHAPSSSGIATLLARLCPFAVASLVMAVVVDAFNRMTGWSRSHISQKSREIVYPFCTDGDTTSAVPRVLGIVWIQAAIFHALPRLILNGSAARRAVLREALLRPFQIKAPATFRASRAQVVANHDGFSAALAAAIPHRLCALAGSLRCQSEHGEARENTTGQVFQAAVHLYAFCSMCVSMIRRTSSAIEIPRRFASRCRNFLCGSVNEIICLTKASLFHLAFKFILRDVLSVDAVPAQAWNVLRRLVRRVSRLDVFAAFPAFVVADGVAFAVLPITPPFEYPSERGRLMLRARVVTRCRLAAHIPAVFMAAGVSNAPACIRAMKRSYVEKVTASLERVGAYFDHSASIPQGIPIQVSA